MGLIGKVNKYYPENPVKADFQDLSKDYFGDILIRPASKSTAMMSA